MQPTFWRGALSLPVAGTDVPLLTRTAFSSARARNSSSSSSGGLSVSAAEAQKRAVVGEKGPLGPAATLGAGEGAHLEADCLGPFGILGLLDQLGFLGLLGQFGILGRGFRQVPCKKRGSGRQEEQAEEPRDRGTEVMAEAHEPGAQQPPGHTQALLQLPLSVGAGVQRILQLGHQPGRNPPEAQPEAAARRAPAARPGSVLSLTCASSLQGASG